MQFSVTGRRPCTAAGELLPFVDEFARADAGLAGDSGEFRVDRLVRLVGCGLLLRAGEQRGDSADHAGDNREGECHGQAVGERSRDQLREEVQAGQVRLLLLAECGQVRSEQFLNRVDAEERREQDGDGGQVRDLGGLRRGHLRRNEDRPSDGLPQRGSVGRHHPRARPTWSSTSGRSPGRPSTTVGPVASRSWASSRLPRACASERMVTRPACTSHDVAIGAYRESSRTSS
ncbi:hypothetical protein CA951_38155 [Rhodococcus sp. NCIMB 12038]|nr:hypothetical protein CA951_38155 [Rhodococcus sp. NCIMB 12038]